MRWLESTWWCALLYTAGFSWDTGFVSIIICYLYTEWNSNPGFDHSHTHTQLNMGGCLHGYESEVLLKQDGDHWDLWAIPAGTLPTPTWEGMSSILDTKWRSGSHWVEFKGWWVCHKLLKYVQGEGENSVQPIVPIQRHQISISC